MYLLATTELHVFEMSSIIAFFCKQYLRDKSCYVLQCLIHTNLLSQACFPWPCALPSHLYLQKVSASILTSVSGNKEALMNRTLSWHVSFTSTTTFFDALNRSFNPCLTFILVHFNFNACHLSIGRDFVALECKLEKSQVDFFVLVVASTSFW